MNDQVAEALDSKLSAYDFRLREEWDGPGPYGFDVTGPDVCEPFGEVEVSESATITLADVPIDSADPANTFPEGVIEGLLEVLIPHEPIFQRFLEARGENELRAVAARHVDRLRESLVTAIHRAMSSTRGSA